MGRQRWLPDRAWWVLELLRDQAARDPNEFHRFLWTHHLAYAESYEVEQRFGTDQLHASRRLLFDDLKASLRARRIDPAKDIHSVFEVGCSLGYLLRFAETQLFPAAEILEGNDIDAYAVREGTRYLESVGSRVRLHHADMTELDRVMGTRRFDVVLCPGVLMYLREEAAGSVVTSILRHTGRVAAFAGLAHPARDNRELAVAEVRERDGTFIHNIDRLVERAGGRVIFRRWEGARQVDGNTIYFVFAEPEA
ncbi:MAG TPA: class I SAM-dependent methyltransferase [Gemmatimonadales bacterium]|nr:class I SAM-dependent methyltransferase [Gemmatimonadales bacterium]